MATIANMKVEPIIDRDSLMVEKIGLAKELGRIDKRLSEIDIALGTVGTRYNSDQSRFPDVNAPEPKPEPFSVVGEFTDELLEELMVREPWYGKYDTESYLCLVMESVTVFPVSKNMERMTVIIEEGKSWRTSQLFELENTVGYNMVSTTDRRLVSYAAGRERPVNSSPRQPFVFIEQIRAGYTGFFIHQNDVKLARRP